MRESISFELGGGHPRGLQELSKIYEKSRLVLMHIVVSSPFWFTPILLLLHYSIHLATSLLHMV